MGIEEPVYVDCPYCGETILIMIDCSVEAQQYIEDCQVCCKPICLDVQIDDAGIPRVTVQREDD